MIRTAHFVPFLILAFLILGACQPIQSPPATPATEDAAAAVAALDPTTVPASEPSATPRPTRPLRVKLTAEHKTLTSKALEGNLLGDPAERGLFVVLPSDYSTSVKRYPVVYVLHGYGGGEYTEPMAFQRAQESALQSGVAKEMIFVFPNADNRLGGSMYLSSPTIGDYETYLTKDLVAYIDANYRTIPYHDSRGITGCSMGADGAIHLAFKYPDVYSVAAPYSGTYDWARDPWVLGGARGFRSEPTSLGEFNAISNIRTKSGLAHAAAVASNPDKPPYFLDMPYEIEDGVARVVPDFVDRLEAASPVQDAKRYVEQAERLHGILLYHGLYDDIAPVERFREFAAFLTDLGIDHEILEVEAGHCGMDKEPILKFMSEHLVFEENGE